MRAPWADTGAFRPRRAFNDRKPTKFAQMPPFTPPRRVLRKGLVEMVPTYSRPPELFTARGDPTPKSLSIQSKGWKISPNHSYRHRFAHSSPKNAPKSPRSPIHTPQITQIPHSHPSNAVILKRSETPQSHKTSHRPTLTTLNTSRRPTYGPVNTKHIVFTPSD